MWQFAQEAPKRRLPRISCSLLRLAVLPLPSIGIVTSSPPAWAARGPATRSATPRHKPAMKDVALLHAEEAAAAAGWDSGSATARRSAPVTSGRSGAVVGLLLLLGPTKAAS